MDQCSHLGPACHVDLYCDVSSRWYVRLCTDVSTWLRFNAGLKAQRIDRQCFLPATDPLQPYSAWYVLVWSPVVLLFSGYYLFYPGAFNGADFIFAYGSVFIFLAIYLGSRLLRARKKDFRMFIPAGSIDFTSGLEEIEALGASNETTQQKTALKDRIRNAL